MEMLGIEKVKGQLVAEKRQRNAYKWEMQWERQIWKLEEINAKSHHRMMESEPKRTKNKQLDEHVHRTKVSWDRDRDRYRYRSDNINRSCNRNRAWLHLNRAPMTEDNRPAKTDGQSQQTTNTVEAPQLRNSRVPQFSRFLLIIYLLNITQKGNWMWTKKCHTKSS